MHIYFHFESAFFVLYFIPQDFLKALNYVTIQAIKEIRSFNSPIHLAKKVQTALCILFAECKTDWKSSKLNLHLQIDFIITS